MPELLLLENYKIDNSSALYEKRIKHFIDKLLVLLLPDKKS